MGLLNLKKNDYFSNHSLAVKWPFTIYHKPIESSLQKALEQVLREKKKPRILVFGSGPFHEEHLFPVDSDLTLVDMDPRLEPLLEETVARRPHARWHLCQTLAELKLKLSGTYDFISAKEVIEHIVDIKPYFEFFFERLNPQACLWVSTPNYGEPVFPTVEITFLELIARSQGFTRRGLHPNKYSRKKLKEELEAIGFKKLQMTTTPLRLALTCLATKES